MENVVNQDYAVNRIEQRLTIDGKEIIVETGEMARSANGSVVIRCGDTVLLVTAVGSDKPRSGIDFFPLLCDFEEKLFAVGKIPGGFIKREGRPSERAVLSCRLMDRPIRPLWPDDYRNDVQVVAAPLSFAGMPVDTLAIFGASCAIELAGLPFLGPIGGVRVAMVDGQFIANPTYEEMSNTVLDLVVAGTEDSIMMVEAGANFVSEDTLLQAIEYAHERIRMQIQAQKELLQKAGVEKKPFESAVDLKPLEKFVSDLLEQEVNAAYHDFDRDGRKEKLEAAKNKLKEKVESLPEDDPIKALINSSDLDYVGMSFKKLEKRLMRAMVINENVRADGRKPEEIRPIWSKVGFLPRTHGSALFTRGNTQVLSICTLASPGEAQSLDGMEPMTEKRWMHHYNFTPFSVGEVRPLRGPGRREIGHGALAERAIQASLPTREEFGYTIRVNSEVLESNGSTSMASTCATSMALMDAGVPVKAPVAGIAMGLIKEGDQYKILSDIQGVEDFLGDMDFKVTGNETGVTALQMDIKIPGITMEILRNALEQARQGRLHILQKMGETIREPRPELSQYAPRIITMHIHPDDIGMVIGPGGKTIKGIIEETGATIDIENDGLVTITSEGTGGEQAKAIIERITMKITPGLVFLGKVVRIIPSGAFVELTPGKDGMVHISQLANFRVNTVQDLLQVGDEVVVKVSEIDDKGRINITMKGVSYEEKLQYMTPEEIEAQEAFFASRNTGPQRQPGGAPGGGRGGDRHGHSHHPVR